VIWLAHTTQFHHLITHCPSEGWWLPACHSCYEATLAKTWLLDGQANNRCEALIGNCIDVARLTDMVLPCNNQTNKPSRIDWDSAWIDIMWIIAPGAILLAAHHVCLTVEHGLLKPLKTSLKRCWKTSAGICGVNCRGIKKFYWWLSRQFIPTAICHNHCKGLAGQHGLATMNCLFGAAEIQYEWKMGVTWTNFKRHHLQKCRNSGEFICIRIRNYPGHLEQQFSQASLGWYLGITSRQMMMSSSLQAGYGPKQTGAIHIVVDEQRLGFGRGRIH